MVSSEIGTQLFVRLIPRIFLIAYFLNGRATTWGNGGKFELAFYYAYPKWARKVERGPESRWGGNYRPRPAVCPGTILFSSWKAEKRGVWYWNLTSSDPSWSVFNRPVENLDVFDPIDGKSCPASIPPGPTAAFYS